MTLWKASRMARISLRKMMDLLKEKNIEAQYGMDELEEGLKTLCD